MSLQHKAYAWIGSPVGVSLADGTSVSSILCIQSNSRYSPVPAMPTASTTCVPNETLILV